MTLNLSTARYGIVTLSAHPTDARFLCFRTLAGARVSRYFRTEEEAVRHAAYMAR